MYDGIKTAFGPSAIKIVPLKSPSGNAITDRSEQMVRWAEHFRELYSEERVVTHTAIECIPSLPIMNELDAPPTIEELREAIDSLASGKAPGDDGIPSEVLKAGNDSSLVNHLHELLLQCWGKAQFP